MKNLIKKNKLEIIWLAIWFVLTFVVAFVPYFTNNMKMKYVITTWGAILLAIVAIWFISRFGLFSGIALKQRQRREQRYIRKGILKKEESEWQKIKLKEYEKQVSSKPKWFIYIGLGIAIILIVIGLVI